jgi:hypothetical protein
MMMSKEDHNAACAFIQRLTGKKKLTLHHKLLVIIAAASLTRIAGYTHPGLGFDLTTVLDEAKTLPPWAALRGED